MTSTLKLVFAGLLSLTLTACDTTPPPENTQAPGVMVTATVESPDTQISAFFAKVYEREVAQNPETQTSLGLDTNTQDAWYDRSDTAAAANIIEQKADLEGLKTFDRDALSHDKRLSYDIFEYKVEQTISDAQFRRQLYVVDQFRGQVTNRVSLLLNAHKIENIKDAEDYIARIIALENVYGEYTARLQDRAAFGVMTPAFAYDDMISDIGGLGTGYPIEDSESRHALLDDFTNKIENLDLTADAKTALLGRVEAAISGPFKAGIDRLVAEIDRQSRLVDGSHGVWALPDGEAFYKAQIKKYSTLDLSADQVHQMGLDDVARIHKEMLTIMETLGFKGSLQDFFVFARTDPSNFYSNDSAGREAFLADARSQTVEIFAVADQYFNKLPKAALEVRQVEAWRENSTSIAFYEGPSKDGSRPGYYYANLKDMTSYQKSVATAITYHEGVPGHHFQIALAQELQGLPMFRKYSSYGAYTEGWALYAERLAKEMGFYKDPMSDFGRLHDEIWRSARLVIDTGIHAKRWTREQAIDYFRQNTPLSEGDMVTEVERFFVWPGQALGYKIGMMKILELRAKAEAELGDAYDIRDFHGVIIGKGAMPLPILEREVEAYIAAKRKK
ncbi:MAG: DUF885 domain-containing protein [Proteobacteria bacterium]|nr:DUF885 domain-containing protein [Pseudomonadota bacterium]